VFAVNRHSERYGKRTCYGDRWDDGCSDISGIVLSHLAIERKTTLKRSDHETELREENYWEEYCSSVVAHTSSTSSTICTIHTARSRPTNARNVNAPLHPVRKQSSNRFWV